MVKSLGKSKINMYSMGACAALGISNQDALSEDLENDPFLNSALQRFFFANCITDWFVLSSLKHWNNYEQTLFI